MVPVALTVFGLKEPRSLIAPSWRNPYSPFVGLLPAATTVLEWLRCVARKPKPSSGLTDQVWCEPMAGKSYNLSVSAKVRGTGPMTASYAPAGFVR